MGELQPDERLRLIQEAERRIQRILLSLEEDTGGVRIDAVNVDTRNFANCAVEIWLRS